MDDATALEELPVEQLIEMIRERTGAGVNLSFPGKVLARQLGRRVRPRNQRTVKFLSCGDENGRSRNLVIEGDNLQALASLYRERGQIDMILTDPPYNTGGDFRYNDKWDKDPNDPDMGEFVGSDDPAKHTKWMKFMYANPLAFAEDVAAADLLAGGRVQLGVSLGSPEQVIDGWRYFGFRPAEGESDADMARRHTDVFLRAIEGERFAEPNP